MSERPLSPPGADVVDRLARLRAILPAMAADLASARRRINTLALENEQLARRVAELEASGCNPREARSATAQGA
jgi:hypothetical protein